MVTPRIRTNTIRAHLTREELCFLLRTKEGRGAPSSCTDETPPSAIIVALFELARRIIPRTLWGWVLICTLLGVLPILGQRLFATLPVAADLGVRLGGILIGAWLLHTHWREGVINAMDDVRQNRVPSLPVLRHCAFCMSGVLLALPSPILSLLGLALLLPNLNRSIAVVLGRRIRLLLADREP